MQLVVNINGTRLTALLDSGSMHNIMDVEAAARDSIQLGASSGLHVAIANGDRVPSLDYYRRMSFSITDELFFIDCYGIALGSHEMVLSIQWLESLGLILWDFGRRVIQFVRNGHTVRWTMTDHTPVPTAFAASTNDIMGDLLLRFEGIFMMPTCLPPV
jgi:hypothetical protein